MTNGYTTPESKISLFEFAGNQKQYEQWLRGDDEADWKTHTIKALHSALENELTDALSNIPVADVAPVSHGRWVKKSVNGISRTEGQDSFAVGE